VGGAAAQEWVGFAPLAQGQVQLFRLGPFAVKQEVITTVNTSATESTATDAFRCIATGPRGAGECVFLTTSSNGNSYLYNISMPSGTLAGKTTLPNAVAHNLHVNDYTGAAYTILFGSSSAQVVSVQNGVITPLVDISKYVTGAAYVPVGGSTQCTDQDQMWVGVHSGSSAPGTLLTLNLTTKAITAVTTMQTSLPASLWAECGWPNGPNYVSGVELNGNTLSYGQITSTGTYTPDDAGTIPSSPSGLQLTGLLSNDPWGGFFTALYPAGQSSGVLGYGIFRPNSTYEFHAISYSLTGAAVIY
jgi:hypothetical protein